LYLVTPYIGWYLVFTGLAKDDVGLEGGLLFWKVLPQIILLPLGLAATTRWLLGRFFCLSRWSQKRSGYPTLTARGLSPEGTVDWLILELLA